MSRKHRVPSISRIVCLLLVWLPAPSLRAAPPITAVALTPDGKDVVLGSQQGIEVRSWPGMVTTATLNTELVHVHDLAFSPDGRLLLAAGGAPTEEGVVEVRRWPDGECIRRVGDHEDVVYRAAWAPDGGHWATASADARCQVFAAETGERLVRYTGHSRAVLAICFMPDGRMVVSAGVDQTLQLWDGVTGEHLRTLDNHVGTVNDVVVRPATADGAPTTVASVSEDRTVRLWQPAIGRLMRFARLPATPRVVAWSPGGDRLLVGCNDGRLRVLEPQTMDVVREQLGLGGRVHGLIAIPASDRVLLAGESGVVSVGW